MEKILQQLLEGQKQLFEGQKQLFEGQRQLFDGQQQLFEGQKQSVESQQQIVTRLGKLESKVDSLADKAVRLEDKLGCLDEKVDGLAVTLQENVAMTGSIQHWTEEVQAQIHGLGHTMDRIEGRVSQLEKQQDVIKADVAFLARKAIEQDEAMYRLQKA